MYGDTATIRKRSAQLREQGADIRALAERLVAQADAVPWRGRAADDMRARIRERAAHLREAAALHDTAADSLARHGQEVDTLKDGIETLEHKARSLVSDAQTRLARQELTGDPPSDADTALAAFSAPPPGHKDWLTVDLPGL